MLLNGRDIAEFVKERHFQEVRAMGITPKLAIVMSNNADMATRTYVKSTKSRYAEEIGADVRVDEVRGGSASVLKLIGDLNSDDTIHGIIVQLPFEGIDTDEVLSAVAPGKDIDGLNPNSEYEPATPKAILWLLAGYGIEYKDKIVVMVGHGRLVGKPLADMLEQSGASVIRCNKQTPDLKAETIKADIIITATGQPNLIQAGMVSPGTVVIDAGTAEIDGNLVGDVDHKLYDDQSLKITPNPGGVGPLTVAALFDNLLLAVKKRQR